MSFRILGLIYHKRKPVNEPTDRELLIETLGWLKSYGFENKPHQFNGLIGRIERQVGTGWARGATPPEPPSMTAPRKR